MNSQLAYSTRDKTQERAFHVTLEKNSNVAWCTLEHIDRPCFTNAVLTELDSALSELAVSIPRIRYFVLASRNPDVFSLGGDLKLFYQLIADRKKDKLDQYMTACIDIIHKLTVIPDCERIALVQGNAFGGGFEAALSCDTIIAEEDAKFGFPERMFNLFPGMGAYNFLIQRVHPALAKRLITSAKTYTAEQLYEMGIVDKLVKQGAGKDAVTEHISHYSRYENSLNAIKDIACTSRRVDYDELLHIGKQWVRCALNLTEKDLGLMVQLERSQSRYSGLVAI